MPKTASRKKVSKAAPTKPGQVSEKGKVVLRRLYKEGPATLVGLEAERHVVLQLLKAKLVARAGKDKNDGTGGRWAVVYKITAKGKQKIQ